MREIVNTQSENSLEIKGNFSWGFAKKQLIEEDEEKQKKQEEKQKENAQKLTNFDQHLHLKNIDLTIKKGEFVCIIGDVGSGKSNLLNAINGEMIYVPEQIMAANSCEGEHSQTWYTDF